MSSAVGVKTLVAPVKAFDDFVHPFKLGIQIKFEETDARHKQRHHQAARSEEHLLGCHNPVNTSIFFLLNVFNDTRERKAS
jgi:hypothetical protein